MKPTGGDIFGPRQRYLRTRTEISLDKSGDIRSQSRIMDRQIKFILVIILPTGCFKLDVLELLGICSLVAEENFTKTKSLNHFNNRSSKDTTNLSNMNLMTSPLTSFSINNDRVNQRVQHYEIFLKKASLGVRKLSFSLGLALIFFLILAIFHSVTVLMSVPFGIYWRTSLLAFSMAPFCHAQ